MHTIYNRPWNWIIHLAYLIIYICISILIMLCMFWVVSRVCVAISSFQLFLVSLAVYPMYKLRLRIMCIFCSKTVDKITCNTCYARRSKCRLKTDGDYQSWGRSPFSRFSTRVWVANCGGKGVVGSYAFVKWSRETECGIVWWSVICIYDSKINLVTWTVLSIHLYRYIVCI